MSGLVDQQINVAQLLKQPVGAARRYQLAVDAVALGEGRVANQITGQIKLTRVGQGLLVTGQAEAVTQLACVRCLEDYRQPLSLELEEQFRPTIDVSSGISIAHHRADEADDADFFLIRDDHVLDLTDALRQAVWLATPMMPICREDCPGIPLAAGDDAGDDEPAEPPAGVPDGRFAILERLLEQPATDGATRATSSRPPARPASDAP